MRREEVGERWGDGNRRKIPYYKDLGAQRWKPMEQGMKAQLPKSCGGCRVSSGQRPPRTPPEDREAVRSQGPRPALRRDSRFRVETKPGNDFPTFENNLPSNSNSNKPRLRIKNIRLMLKSTGEIRSVKTIAHSGLFKMDVLVDCFTTAA